MTSEIKSEFVKTAGEVIFTELIKMCEEFEVLVKPSILIATAIENTDYGTNDFFTYTHSFFKMPAIVKQDTLKRPSAYVFNPNSDFSNQRALRQAYRGFASPADSVWGYMDAVNKDEVFRIRFSKVSSMRTQIRMLEQQLLRQHTLAYVENILYYIKKYNLEVLDNVQ